MREIELHVEASLAEDFSDALLSAGMASVTLTDADADTEAECALFGEPGFTPSRAAWHHNRIVALFNENDDTDAATLIQAAWSSLGQSAPAPDFLTREFPDDDWVSRTQSQFPPVKISDRLWIVPSWHEAPDPQAIVVRLDPGVAFGTGTHPTTRLCLQWLESSMPPDRHVMDYGCGSGVLSIAAALLGAKRVSGVDIDEQAVTAAHDNALRNGVIANYSAAPPTAEAFSRFDVVVANILAMPLIVLAPLLTSLLAPGGTLVLSGILERQAEQVISAFVAVPRPVQLSIFGGSEGWIALTGKAAH